MVMRAIEVVRERRWRDRSREVGEEPGSRADAYVRLVEEALAAEATRGGQASGVPVELVVDVGPAGVLVQVGLLEQGSATAAPGGPMGEGPVARGRSQGSSMAPAFPRERWSGWPAMR